MKKLFFTMLMMLCGITAAMAQNVNPAPRENVECGTQVSMTATPEPSYRFDYWEATWQGGSANYTNGNGNIANGDSYQCEANGTNGSKLTVVMPGYDVTYIAHFAQLGTYTIIVQTALITDPNDHSQGTATHTNPNGDNNYFMDDPKPVIDIPDGNIDACYEFDHWECDKPGYITDANKNNKSINFAGSTFTESQTYTFTAVLRKKSHTITLQSSNLSEGSVSFQ